MKILEVNIELIKPAAQQPAKRETANDARRVTSHKYKLLRNQCRSLPVPRYITVTENIRETEFQCQFQAPKYSAGMSACCSERKIQRYKVYLPCTDRTGSEGVVGEDNPVDKKQNALYTVMKCSRKDK